MEKKSFMRDASAVFTFLLPIVYIVLGTILLFVQDINTKVLAELLGVLLLIVGAALVIHYFLTRSYLDMHSYGFSFGALAIVVGVCVIIRASAVAESLSVFLNLCIMMTAIIKLQNAIQLKFLKSRAWIPVLCVALAFLICTVLIVIDPFAKSTTRDMFTYIVLVCDGVATFANMIVLRIIMRRFHTGTSRDITRV